MCLNFDIKSAWFRSSIVDALDRRFELIFALCVGGAPMPSMSTPRRSAGAWEASLRFQTGAVARRVGRGVSWSLGVLWRSGFWPANPVVRRRRRRRAHRRHVRARPPKQTYLTSPRRSLPSHFEGCARCWTCLTEGPRHHPRPAPPTCCLPPGRWRSRTSPCPPLPCCCRGKIPSRPSRLLRLHHRRPRRSALIGHLPCRPVDKSLARSDPEPKSK